jgi:peptidoglycan/xylan/chitin deacetylase (PgdA/CDA1 family)
MMDLTKRLSRDGSLAIFLFHGVVEQSNWQIRNYTAKHLKASDFRGSLESLARCGEPLSMDQVATICASGQPFPSGAFAITFDDGFENNLLIARPILEELKIPATVYVTTRFVDENVMSWIDRIEWALERAPAGILQLPWLVEAVEFSDKESKICLLDDIRRNVKTSREIDVESLVTSVFQQLDLEEVRFSQCPLDKKLTWQQVRQWIAPGYIVGGHSHNHSILTFLSPAELAWELDTSLSLLRERADIMVSHYSYPEGLAHCYSDDVITALKLRGICCCPTAIDGVNRPGSDPFQLRRVMAV